MFVYVVKHGDGFIVHDGGGAFRSAWIHGRDDGLIRRSLTRASERFFSEVRDDMVSTTADSIEWLQAAIISVANASASGAALAVEKISAATEKALALKIQGVLLRLFPEKSVAREFSVAGRSGKTHTFDFAVRDMGRTILLDAIAPHHVSIAAKYVAFSDSKYDGSGVIDRFAVFDKPIDASDRALIEQVADLVPLASLERGLQRAVLK
ncbi:hypothetical protein [Xanthobacter tagetidis]|uniref:hypothetical protein n=1 Tax=Xanthobacter tagetidis TaxID=60216 RepID=UPI0011C3E913|nr:hypothetical protein [Xanthobacter tagetidis]MBB6308317.1 hypothetical protein [Xanthobacter tagetidis]